MARIKGGMNARRKHNKVLKLAKGYRGARSKQYRVAKQSVMRAAQASDETALDCSYQRSSKNEWTFLQQIYARFKTCRCRSEQKNAGRDGSKRCKRVHNTRRGCKI